MNLSRLTVSQRRLILSAPMDGSQDLYVSTMVGMPQRLVARVRVMLMGADRRPAGTGPRKGGS